MSHPLPILSEIASRDLDVIGMMEAGVFDSAIKAATTASQADVRSLLDVVSSIGILASREESLCSDFLLDLIAETLGQP